MEKFKAQNKTWSNFCIFLAYFTVVFSVHLFLKELVSLHLNFFSPYNITPKRSLHYQEIYQISISP